MPFALRNQPNGYFINLREIDELIRPESAPLKNPSGIARQCFQCRKGGIFDGLTLDFFRDDYLK
jgi:hypothetical protein